MGKGPQWLWQRNAKSTRITEKEKQDWFQLICVYLCPSVVSESPYGGRGVAVSTEECESSGTGSSPVGLPFFQRMKDEGERMNGESPLRASVPPCLRAFFNYI